MKTAYTILSEMRSDMRPIKDVLDTMNYQNMYDKEYNLDGQSKLQCINEGARLIKSMIIGLADKYREEGI